MARETKGVPVHELDKALVSQFSDGAETCDCATDVDACDEATVIDKWLGAGSAASDASSSDGTDEEPAATALDGAAATDSSLTKLVARAADLDRPATDIVAALVELIKIYVPERVRAASKAKFKKRAKIRKQAAPPRVADKKGRTDRAVAKLLSAMQTLGTTQAEFDDRWCLHTLLTDALARGATTRVPASLGEFQKALTNRPGGGRGRSTGDLAAAPEAAATGAGAGTGDGGDDDGGGGDDAGGPSSLRLSRAELSYDHAWELLYSGKNSLKNLVASLLDSPDREHALYVLTYLSHFCVKCCNVSDWS